MSKLKLVFLMIAIMIATLTFAQREVGQIIATDPENDELVFTLIEDESETYGVQGNGMLYISNEYNLQIGIDTILVRVKEINTLEQYEDFANIYIMVDGPMLISDSTVIDSIYFPKYIKTFYSEIENIDSTWIIDSMETIIWVDNSYWSIDTTHIIDSTQIMYTPIEATYESDTIKDLKDQLKIIIPLI